MANSNSLITIFKNLKKEGLVRQILLLDSNSAPIGSLTFDAVDLYDVVITTTSLSEKYCLYYKGFTVFFTSWRKVDS